MASLAIVHDTAPSKHPHPSQDLRATVEALRRRHRHADAEKLGQYLMTAVSENDDLLLECCQFVCTRIGATIDARARRQQAAPSGRERIARKAAERQEVQEIAAKVKELALLDLIMPNGVAMRLCTGAQMADFGSMYQTIATKVGPANLVGEVLCEADCVALLNVE